MKQSVVFLAFVLLGLVLGQLNPFFLETDSAAKFVYFTPSIVWLVFALTRRHYSRRSTAPEEKIEKIKSLIRSAITVVGTVIALAGALNLNLPFIDQLRGALTYITENFDTSANAVIVLLGFVTGIYGYFKNPERFEERSTKINGKELIIED